MKKFILLLFVALFCGVNAFAHEAFTLVSSEKKTIKLADLIEIEKTRTIGKKEKLNLTFTEKEIRLVIKTGPADDMLSYRILGMRNPNLIVPAGATLKILFVNSDDDMRHDVRFGHITKDFELTPDIAETVGSNKLEPKVEDGTMQAEEIVIKTGENGAYKYFCSIRGHAKGGMWGNILVGETASENLKIAPKTDHVHSSDEEHSHDEMNEKNPAQKPSEPMPGMNQDEHEKMKGMPGMNHDSDDEHQMRSTVNLNDPMSRESSGTAWIPDSSPMYARMKMFADGGMLMLHGTAYFRYTNVGSDRDLSMAGKGDRERFDAPSMLMAMYSRPLTKNSQLGLRVMTSLDPIFQRGYGYPLLYQSGELYRDQPLHDRQHPHDFISELAVTYSYKFDDKNSVFVYAGLPGEPALGPPMFMHRPSGMNSADAPISHHWQDSTHIAFGVVTAGFTHDNLKFEASAFKGEEPDENRWNFDRPKLDSFSGRFSWNPSKNWALQISHGYLKNPEPAEPGIKILRRTTASAIYNRNFSGDRNFSGTFVWGRNHTDENRTNAFLFEGNYQFQKNNIFARLEQVQKSGHELALENHDDEHRVFLVGAYSVGYVRDLIKDKGIDIGLGAQATYNRNPAGLIPYYGGQNHGGFQIFLRLRPSKMK